MTKNKFHHKDPSNSAAVAPVVLQDASVAVVPIAVCDPSLEKTEEIHEL